MHVISATNPKMFGIPGACHIGGNNLSMQDFASAGVFTQAATFVGKNVLLTSGCDEDTSTTILLYMQRGANVDEVFIINY